MISVPTTHSTSTTTSTSPVAPGREGFGMAILVMRQI